MANISVMRGQAAPLAQRLMLRDLALVPVIIAMMIAGSFLSHGFLMTDNPANVLQQPELPILVIVQSLILIRGKLDLPLECRDCCRTC